MLFLADIENALPGSGLKRPLCARILEIRRSRIGRRPSHEHAPRNPLVANAFRCLVAILLLAIGSACSRKPVDLDFCQVLAAAPSFHGVLFRADIIVVPSPHGYFAVGSGCNGWNVLQFTAESFSVSPQLERLHSAVIDASLAAGSNESPGGKAVSARVTAEVVKLEPPEKGYALNVLQAEQVTIVNAPALDASVERSMEHLMRAAGSR